VLNRTRQRLTEQAKTDPYIAKVITLLDLHPYLGCEDMLAESLMALSDVLHETERRVPLVDTKAEKPTKHSRAEAVEPDKINGYSAPLPESVTTNDTTEVQRANA